MNEWGIGKQCPRFQSSVRRVLSELDVEALVSLKDPRLEVVIMRDEGHSVWACFPIRARNYTRLCMGPDYRLLVAHKVLRRPKPETRVLLVFSTAGIAGEPVKTFQDNLRDHLGHVLLYLRSPKAPNHCADAQKEWRRSRRAPAARWGKRKPAQERDRAG
jgi:hypothetical protein